MHFRRGLLILYGSIALVCATSSFSLAADDSNSEELVAGKIGAYNAVLPTILGLESELRAQALGSADQDFAALVEQGHFKITKEGLGKAEFTLIDRIPVIRVVLEDVPNSFVVIDDHLIDRYSDHLAQYIARQHIEAGSTAGHKGRPVTLIWKHTGLPDERPIFEDLPIPTGMEWLSEWWKATYKKPCKEELAIAAGCIIAQVGVASCLTAAKIGLSPELTLAHDFVTQATPPVVLSAIWAAGFGTFNSTYRNFVYRGTRWQMTLKRLMLVSLPFAYALKVWQEGVSPTTLLVVDHVGWDQNGHLAFGLSSVGLWIHFRALLNSFLNNAGASAYQMFNRLRERTRKATGASASFEQQAIYIAFPYTIKIADITDVNLHLGPVDIPLGTILLVSSIPGADYFVMRYAEQIGAEEAAQFRADFEAKRAHSVWGLIYKPIAAIGKALEPLFWRCASYLKKPR